MLRKLGSLLFKGSRWEEEVFRYYMKASESFDYRKLPWTPYQINNNFSTFQMYLPPRHKSPSHDQKINGEYEDDIMEFLTDEITDSDVFWEVGGGWGYFSLAMAEVAERVVAFEADPERVGYIKRSIKKNGYSNVEIIQTIIGKNNSLDEYLPVDVVLMDIEGWEYEALHFSPQLIDSRPTFVIELHDTEKLYMDEPDVKPADTIKLLEENGYSIQVLSERTEGNYHVIAKG